jgi:hypothetical protein
MSENSQKSARPAVNAGRVCYMIEHTLPNEAKGMDAPITQDVLTLPRKLPKGQAQSGGPDPRANG